MQIKNLAPLAVCLQASFTPLHAFAETVLAPIVVTESQDEAESLDDRAATATHLPLSLDETPATLEIVSGTEMQEQGARTLDEALRASAGVTAGGNPSSPFQTSLRGFTSGFVTHLYDGVRISVPTMSARRQDSWNAERVEVLKGPASLIHGEGAIGGVINVVSKRPDASGAFTDMLIGAGSFGTRRVGIDMNRSLGEDAALRLNYSHQRSAGYVDRNRQRYDHVTLAYVKKFQPGLSLDILVDHFQDDIRAYQGTPLVPATFAVSPVGAVQDASGRVIDRELVFRNYNVDDAAMRARSTWLRTGLEWQVTPSWSLRNKLSYYTADRAWRNAERHSFLAPNLLARDLVGVTHDHQVVHNRFDATMEGQLYGLRNRLLVGLEYTNTDFNTQRRFSNGSEGTERLLLVDILVQTYGNYDMFASDPSIYEGAGNRTDFKTGIPAYSLFAEDALSISDRLLLVAGLRQDRIKIKRDSTDLETGVTDTFIRTYHPRSARLGVIYRHNAETSLYAQFATAAAPVGSGNLLLMNARNAEFDLSRGRQFELGIRQSLLEGRVSYSLAAYRITLEGILNRDSTTRSRVVNSGAQTSRGVELSASWQASRQLSLTGNLAWVDAEYLRLEEAGGSRAGNRPPNVPARVANLWLDYRLTALPVTIGLGLQHTGDRYTDPANTVRMDAYTVADAYASWQLRPGSTLSLRVRNLGNVAYAQWGGADPTSQVIMGAPRSAELVFRTTF